jgi:hypothetical protein
MFNCHIVARLRKYILCEQAICSTYSECVSLRLSSKITILNFWCAHCLCASLNIVPSKHSTGWMYTSTYSWRRHYMEKYRSIQILTAIPLKRNTSAYWIWGKMGELGWRDWTRGKFTFIFRVKEKCPSKCIYVSIYSELNRHQSKFNNIFILHW